jgi:hypothetical protein
LHPPLDVKTNELSCCVEWKLPGEHKMLLNRFVACCCMLLVLAAPAVADTEPAVAESLMRKSGLWEQLGDVAREVRTGMLASTGQGSRKPSETEAARLSSAVERAYSVDRLRSVCLAVLSRELDPSHLPALNAWYDGTLGRTIARLEEAASRKGESREMIEQGAALLRNMPDSRRRTLHEIVLVTRSAELAAELTISTAVATQQAAASVSPNAARASAAELRAVLERQRQQLIRTYGALSLVSFAVTYSSLSSDDLAAYIEFLRSEAGQHYSAAGIRAISAAMLKAAAEFGRALPGAKDKSHT